MNNGDEKKKPSGIASGLAGIAFISQLGMTIIAPIILGALLGNWIDGKLGTDMIFFLILFGLGIATGIYGAYKLIKALNKKKY